MATYLGVSVMGAYSNKSVDEGVGHDKDFKKEI